MYEAFFGMEHTPFVRDVPPEKLYESNAFRETLGPVSYTHLLAPPAAALPLTDFPGYATE